MAVAGAGAAGDAGGGACWCAVAVVGAAGDAGGWCWCCGGGRWR